MHRFILAVLPTLVFLANPGLGLADAPAPLRDGAGQETVENRCGGCHTLNYIRMNAPFLSEAQWKAEVAKMRQAFGAPIDDDEATEIVSYLAAHYGGTNRQ
jgi:mono/diheme cytochrome c family protein